MKYLIMAVFFLLVACATYGPNTPSASGPIPTENLKIKKMAPLSYQYETVHVGCSEVEFLKKHAGTYLKLDNGNTMFVDNILDIHVDMHSVKVAAKGYVYTCSFWGVAVEYAR
ncbi:MAG: hypothetical protein J5791_01785 [Fibrobacter sp.]|jgi:hypothetical protein|nr:hypothetical protein [Fibrobacter sp.]